MACLRVVHAIWFDQFSAVAVLKITFFLAPGILPASHVTWDVLSDKTDRLFIDVRF